MYLKKLNFNKIHIFNTNNLNLIIDPDCKKNCPGTDCPKKC